MWGYSRNPQLAESHNTISLTVQTGKWHINFTILSPQKSIFALLYQYGPRSRKLYQAGKSLSLTLAIQCTVCTTLDPLDIRSGVKQGCVLTLTLFGIFFAVMMKHAFGTATGGVYLWTRSDGKLFKLSRLRAKTKVQLKCMWDFLFTDDAASESWTLCAQQERKLNTFHMRSLQRIFGITWQDKVPNRVVLEWAGIFIYLFISLFI